MTTYPLFTGNNTLSFQAENNLSIMLAMLVLIRNMWMCYVGIEAVVLVILSVGAIKMDSQKFLHSLII